MRLSRYCEAVSAVFRTFVDTRLKAILDLMSRNNEEGLPREAEPLKRTTLFEKETVLSRVGVAFVSLYFIWPWAYYFSCHYCVDVLRSKFGYIWEHGYYQKYWVLMGWVLSNRLALILCRYIELSKVLKVQLIIFFPLMILCYTTFIFYHTQDVIVSIQCLVMAFAPSVFPAIAVLYPYSSVFRRSLLKNLVRDLPGFS